MQSNILSAVNNEKWSRNSNAISISDGSYGCAAGTSSAPVGTPVDSVLSGDLLPGGDTCDADGCTRRGPEQVIPEDLSGVEKVFLLFPSYSHKNQDFLFCFPAYSYENPLKVIEK